MSNDKITEAYSEALESADVIPMTSEELFRLGWQAAVARQPESEPVEFTDYDPGAINDWGGGNVGWWQDYIRSEINRANDYWREQTGPDSLYTSPQPTPQVPAKITPEQCPFIDDEDSEEACNGYADGWNDCVETMFAAPSIANGEE